MKYKVGDKVRIVFEKTISALWNKRMNKYLGTIMTIKSVGPTRYTMVEDEEEWGWYENMISHKMGKIREDKTMKYSEVIAELEKDDGKEFESDWYDDYIKLIVLGGAIQTLNKTGTIITKHGMSLSREWKEVDKSVEFMDAIKAFGKGEEIHCKIDYQVHAYNPNITSELRDVRLDEIISLSEILHGKWYIKD